MNLIRWEQGYECWVSIDWPNGSHVGWECSVRIEDAAGNRLAFGDLLDNNARIVWPAVRPEGAARVRITGQHRNYLGRFPLFEADIV